MHGRQLPRSGAAVLYCLALLMAAGVTACASAASSPAAGRGAPSPPPLGTVPTSGYTQAAAALPLAAYRLSEQDLTAIRNADEILIQRCMESKGFAYPVTLSSAGYALPANEPYGITDEAQAAARGYAQPGSGGLDPADGNGLPSLTQLQQEHGAAYVQALFGNTDEAGGSQQASGCINANKQLLSGGPQAHSDLSLAGELTTQSEQLTESDPRVRAAERAWQGCMKSKGFSFATPMQAQAASWPAEPDATEIATATADVQCKTSTNLPGTWLAVEAAYQRSLISSHESQLAELNLELQAEVQRATTLLDGKQG